MGLGLFPSSALKQFGAAIRTQGSSPFKQMNCTVLSIMQTLIFCCHNGRDQMPLLATYLLLIHTHKMTATGWRFGKRIGIRKNIYETSVILWHWQKRWFLYNGVLSKFKHFWLLNNIGHSSILAGRHWTPLSIIFIVAWSMGMKLNWKMSSH